VLFVSPFGQLPDGMQLLWLVGGVERSFALGPACVFLVVESVLVNLLLAAMYDLI
jgi:hypothetical protein